MADAYARTSGRVAVLSVHQGCGLTNAMTGITEAAKSRTPLVVLAADVAGSAVGSNFRIDQDALVRSVGAVPERVHSPGSAWTTSAGPTGPPSTAVARWCSICRSTSRRPRSPTPVGSSPCRPPPGPPRSPPSPMLWPTLLGDAERPVFLAGRGAMAYGREIAGPGRPRRCAADHVRRRGRDVRGRGVRPRDLRRVRHPAGRRAGRRRGLVVAWGCSLTSWTTRHGTLLGAGGDAGPGRRRSGRPRRPPAGGSRGAGDVGLTVAAWPTGWPASEAAPATGPRTWLVGSGTRALAAGAVSPTCRPRHDRSAGT